MANPSQLVAVIPPPPGEKADFVNPPTQTKSTIVLHTVCLAFVTLSVAIRVYTRHFISRQMSWDDYCCLVAYALTIMFSGLMIESDARGLGRHLWDIPAVQIPHILQVFTYAQYVYLVLAATVKLSCLLFYCRVFAPSKRTMWFVNGGILFILTAYTVMFFSTVFQCVPVRKAWNQHTPGHCFPPERLPYASGAINVLSDIYVLIVPIPCILSLNLKQSRKLRTLAIFSLGIFACTASVIRLGMTSRLFSGLDSTWNLSQIGIWAVVEVNVGIMCACSLAFRAFFERHGLQGFGSLLNRLISYPISRSTRRGEKSTDATRSTASFCNWKLTLGTRPGTIKLDTDEDEEPVKLPSTTARDASHRHSPKTSMANYSNDDI